MVSRRRHESLLHSAAHRILRTQWKELTDLEGSSVDYLLAATISRGNTAHRLCPSMASGSGDRGPTDNPSINDRLLEGLRKVRSPEPLHERGKSVFRCSLVTGRHGRFDPSTGPDRSPQLHSFAIVRVWPLLSGS
jgi:hypothetical protein